MMAELLKVGEVDWDDVETQTGGGGRFVSLKDVGDHRMRVLSKPHVYFCRWVPDATGKEVKISCAFKADCKVCRPRLGDKNPQQKYYCLVIDRTDTDEQNPTGKIRVLDMGTQISGGIRSLHNDPDWGNVRGYDIKVNRGPKGSNPLYTVKPVSKTALTDQEKMMAKAALTPGHKSYVDLAKMCEPMSCEDTHKLLQGGNGSDSSFGYGQNTTATTAEDTSDLDFLGDDFDESQKSPAEGSVATTTAAVDDDEDDFLELT